METGLGQTGKGEPGDLPLLPKRLVSLRGRITQRTARLVVNRLLYLAAEDAQLPVPMTINSPGGAITQYSEIIRVMDSISCPIATFCQGEVRGAAIIIAAHGLRGCRAAAPDCRFSFSADGADEKQERLPATLTRVLFKDASREAQLLGWLETGARFTPEEAVQSGLIDAISPTPIFRSVRSGGGIPPANAGLLLALAFLHMLT